MSERGWDYNADDVVGSWEALVAATRWMPGTTLEVEDHYGQVVLRVNIKTKDSFNPENEVVITHRHTLASYGCRPMDPDAMERLLHGRLRQVAIHEADEWVVIGRRRPFNPHRGEKR